MKVSSTTRPTWLAFAAALLAVSALTQGCEGSSAIARDKLHQLVLTAADAPGFSSFYEGAQTRADNQGTARSDDSRFGREGGWIARLRQSDLVQTSGPLVVESRADLFKTGDGAKSDLRAYRTALERINGGDVQRVAVSSLGEDAVAVTFTQAGGRQLRFYRIAWRYKNATASVLVEGFDGQVTLQEALDLARKQQKRLVAAAA